MRRGIGRLRARGSGVALPPSTNQEAWFRKGVGITSAASAVSNWANQAASGSARDLAQATGAAQPTLQGTGTILFNGTSHVLKCSAFTLNQPETIYLRFKQVTWTANHTVFDGGAVNSGLVFQNISTPNLTIYAGTNGPSNNALVLNTWGTLAAVINGVSSLLQVDATTSATSNANANNMGGFTLGSDGSGASNFSNIEVAEVIVYSVAHDATQRAAVFAYLNTL